MPVAGRRLSMGEETLRDDQVQTVLRPRHRDIKQSAFLLDLVGRTDAEIRGNAAVDRIEHEDRTPFLTLGRMDGREDQIILIEQRYAGLAGGRVRRIERQFGQEPLARQPCARFLQISPMTWMRSRR
jgi:hypothetical protein